MLLTLALVILFATIMVFFSQEFIRAFKKFLQSEALSYSFL